MVKVILKDLAPMASLKILSKSKKIQTREEETDGLDQVIWEISVKMQRITKLNNMICWALIIAGTAWLAGCSRKQHGQVEEQSEKSVSSQLSEAKKPSGERPLLEESKGKQEETIHNILRLAKVYEMFKSENGYVPEGHGFFEALLKQERFGGKYVDDLVVDTVDGWGNPLQILSDMDGNYWIASGGSDGRFDGFGQRGEYLMVSQEYFSKDIVYFRSAQAKEGRFTFHPKFN